MIPPIPREVVAAGLLSPPTAGLLLLSPVGLFLFAMGVLPPGELLLPPTEPPPPMLFPLLAVEGLLPGELFPLFPVGMLLGTADLVAAMRLLFPPVGVALPPVGLLLPPGLVLAPGLLFPPLVGSAAGFAPPKVATGVFVLVREMILFTEPTPLVSPGKAI